MRLISLLALMLPPIVDPTECKSWDVLLSLLNVEIRSTPIKRSFHYDEKPLIFSTPNHEGQEVPKSCSNVIFRRKRVAEDDNVAAKVLWCLSCTANYLHLHRQLQEVRGTELPGVALIFSC